MKKKVIFASIALIAVVSTAISVKDTDQYLTSPLRLANIEALSGDESSDCHYNNGYVAFTSKSGGAYDCCKIWVNRAPNTNEGHCH